MAATKTLSIRLSLQDAETVRAALEKLGADGQRALQRIEQVGQGPSAGLKALDAAAESAKEQIAGLAGEAGTVGRVLSAMGPVGIAAAAGLGAVTTIMTLATDEAEAYAKSFNRLQGVLTATGNAAGLTAKQIAEAAAQIQDSTLADERAALDAAAALATFGTVSGENFTRTLKLAQDMAAVFGGDLREKAVQLGRALADPVEGMTSLRRAGVVLTESQRELIKTLAETGKTAEAQGALLQAIESRVGGAGAAERGVGLSGSVKGLTDAWHDMLRAWGETSAVGGVVTGTLNAITGALRAVTPAAESLDDLRRKLAEVEANPNYGRTARGSSIRNSVLADLRQRIAQMERERAESEANAAAGAQTAQAEAAREAAKAHADALAKVNEQLDHQLELVRMTDEARARTVAMDQAEAKARSEIKGITAEEVAQIRAKAAATYDAEQAIKNQLATERLALDQRYEQEKQLAEFNTAIAEQVEALQVEAAQLQMTAQDRLVDVEIRKAWADAVKAGTDLTAEQVAAITENARALATYRETSDAAKDASRDLARTAHDFTSVIGKDIEEAVLKGGSLSAMFKALDQDIARIILRVAVFKPLENALTGLFTPAAGGGSSPAGDLFSGAMNWLSGLFHGGGVVGGPTFGSKSVPAWVFAGAPRYHAGGMVGLGPDEVPIIAQRGERILSRGQAAASGVTLHQTINIDARGADAGVETRLRAIARDIGEQTLGTLMDDINRGGPFAAAVGRVRG